MIFARMARRNNCHCIGTASRFYIRSWTILVECTTKAAFVVFAAHSSGASRLRFVISPGGKDFVTGSGRKQEGFSGIILTLFSLQQFSMPIPTAGNADLWNRSFSLFLENVFVYLGSA